MLKPKLRTFKGSFTCRWAPSDGEDGAYTDYSYNISKNKTSKNSSTAPTDCYYSTWQDAPIATTETYPFLWMKMERKNDASDKSVSYVCVTGDKGDKGDPGDNGTDGNGIASQVSLFVATDKKAVASYGSVSGWSNLFPQPTEQKPYVWKCVKTTYTKKANTYSTPELVTIYQSGTNGNILRNASFTDSGNMEAWVTQSKYSMLSGSAPIGDGEGIDTSNKLHGHNSYFDRCSGVSGAANYKDVLVQTIHHPNGGLKNIVNGQWYTLSFWAKRAINVITLNKTVSATSYAMANVYLEAGIEYAISVQSTISSASYTIATIVTLNGTSAPSLIIKQTASGRKTGYLTPSISGICVIRSIVSGGTGTVISYAVDDSRDLSTYLAPSIVDTGSKIYVDNEERTPSADLAVVWSLTSDWSFHTLTFKAASSLTASVKQQLIFRLDSVPHVDLWRKVWICEPKLESGMMYTGYVDSSEDLKGIPGMVVRTSEWAVGVLYHNDENLTGGVRYLDVVTVTNSDGSYSIYQCRQTHTSTASNKPSSSMWTAVNKFTTPIYTPLIIADNAVLRFGQTNRFLIMDTTGKKVQGCLTGVDDTTKPMVWFGGETASAANFALGYDGTIKALRGIFGGVMKKSKTVVTPETFLDYFEYVSGDLDYYTIRWEKLSMFFELKGDFKNFVSEGSVVVEIFMPGIRPEVTYKQEAMDEARSFVGASVCICNSSSTNFALTGGMASLNNNKLSFNSPPLVVGNIIYMSCIAAEGSNDYESIGWTYKVMKKK